MFKMVINTERAIFLNFNNKSRGYTDLSPSMAFVHCAVLGLPVPRLRPSLFSRAFSALRRRFSAWSFSSSVCVFSSSVLPLEFSVDVPVVYSLAISPCGLSLSNTWLWIYSSYSGDKFHAKLCLFSIFFYDHSLFFCWIMIWPRAS